jgi:hypothetical protein
LGARATTVRTILRSASPSPNAVADKKKLREQDGLKKKLVFDVVKDPRLSHGFLTLRNDNSCNVHAKVRWVSIPKGDPYNGRYEYYELWLQSGATKNVAYWFSDWETRDPEVVFVEETR